MINSRNSLRLCFIAILCGFGVSCRTVSTTAYPNAQAPQGGEAVGFPYFLPKGVLTLKFVAGAPTEKKTTIELAAALVADSSTTYFLRPVRNATFDYKHIYEVDAQGLLTTVSTDDTGKGDVIADNLGKLLIEVAKFGSGWKFNANDVSVDSVILPDDGSLRDLWFASFERPTPEEIANRLEEMANQRLSLLVDGTGSDYTYDTGALRILIARQRLFPNAAGGFSLTGAERFSGLLARTNDPHAVTLKIFLDMRDIYRRRLAGPEGFISKASAGQKSLADAEEAQRASLEEAAVAAKAYEDIKALQQVYADTVVASAKSVLAGPSADSREKLADATKIADEHAELLIAAKTAKDTADDAVATARETVTTARNRLALYRYLADKTAVLSTIGQAIWYPVLNQSANFKYPDATSTVALPLFRSPVGQSIHIITLDQGVLKKQDSKEPSTVAGIVQIPLNLAKEVIQIPAQIATFHLDVPTRGLTLANKELEVVNKKIDIAAQQIALLEKQEALRLKEKELEDKKKAEADKPAPKPAPDDQPKS